MFFDKNVYGVGNKNDSIIETDKDSDVEQINLMQYINANEHLYFNEHFDEFYVKNFTKRFDKFRRKEKVITKEFPHETDPLRAYIFQYEIEVRCNLKLSFIRILKDTKTIRRTES